MPVPVDPGVAVAHTAATAAAINARLAPLYNTLTPASVGIDDSNVKVAGLSDLSLVSPTSAVWRTVLTSYMPIAGITTGAYYASTNGMNLSGSGSAQTAQGLWVPPSAGDVAVAGKTTRLRLRVPWVTNTTAPGINMTWGLYPVTAASGAGSGSMTLTLGAVVAGSTAVVNAPAGSSGGAATGSSFDLSAVVGAGIFIIGVTGSGSQAANSLLDCQPILEMRHT